MHWLLYTSDREHGGKFVLGVFDTEEEAWQHYLDTHNENERYYNIPFVEQWNGAKRIKKEEQGDIDATK